MIRVLLACFSFMVCASTAAVGSPGEAQVVLKSMMGELPVRLELKHVNGGVWGDVFADAVPESYPGDSWRPETVLLNFHLADPKGFEKGMPARTERLEFYVPGCGRLAVGDATIEGDGERFVIKAPSVKLHPLACKDIEQREYTGIEVEFLGFDPPAKEAMNLISAEAHASCDVRQVTSYAAAEMSGLEARVNPTDFHINPYRIGGGLFDYMFIDSYEQTGPRQFDRTGSANLAFGDKVVIIAPMVGDAFVEVERISDQTIAIIPTDALITGDLESCDPRVLLGDKLVEGVHVAIRPDAKPVGGSRWITDPLVKYGYCKEIVGKTIRCQTRAYPRSDFHDPRFEATLDEVELLTALPADW